MMPLVWTIFHSVSHSPLAWVVLKIYIFNKLTTCRTYMYTYSMKIYMCIHVPYYMKFWRKVNLAILKNPYLAALQLSNFNVNFGT